MERVLLAEDWFIYVVREDGFVWRYNTELWHEWHGRKHSEPVEVMIPYRFNHSATLLRENGKPITMQAFEEQLQQR